MRDAHHAFGVDLDLFGFQTQIDQGSLWKRCFGLDVTSAQAQVREPTVGNRLVGPCRSRHSCRVDPVLEYRRHVIEEIQKMYARLAIRIGPSHASVPFNVQAPFGQLKTQTKDISANLGLRSQYLHPGLAEVEEDSFKFLKIRKRELHR